MNKHILCKSLKLDKCFRQYATNKSEWKQEVNNKFANVWGANLANHFLSKYSDAESLIWALDDNNLNLFINKF